MHCAHDRPPAQYDHGQLPGDGFGRRKDQGVRHTQEAPREQEIDILRNGKGCGTDRELNSIGISLKLSNNFFIAYLLRKPILH